MCVDKCGTENVVTIESEEAFIALASIRVRIVHIQAYRVSRAHRSSLDYSHFGANSKHISVRK